MTNSKGQQIVFVEHPILGDQEKVFKYFLGLEKKQMKKAYNHSRPNLLCYEKGTAFKEYYNKTFK